MYYFMMRERRSLFVTGANTGGGGERAPPTLDLHILLFLAIFIYINQASKNRLYLEMCKILKWIYEKSCC